MKTRFRSISPYTDDFKRMQLFAKSFDHEIHPWKNGRVFAFERGDKVYGYADVIYLPVAFPAFHPEITEPRAVIEVMEGWRTYCEISHDGEGWIAAPTEGHRPSTFPAETVEKLGYARMNREIYQLVERD